MERDCIASGLKTVFDPLIWETLGVFPEGCHGPIGAESASPVAPPTRHFGPAERTARR
jgi:hypothetical protein